MKRAFFLFLPFLLLTVCMLVGFEVFSQQTLKSIQGFVTADGEPLNGVKVTPKNFKGPYQYTREGVFSFRGSFVPGETYLFSLEKVGYRFISDIGLHPSKEGYLGSILMEKIPQKKSDTSAIYEPFRQGGNDFKILIFPFDPYSTCKNTDKYCLENIRDRFIKMNEHSDFRVTVKTDDRFNIEYPMQYDSAKAIGMWYNADMVVWGDYEQQCNWDSSLFNVKFVTLSKEEHNLFKGVQGESYQRIGSFRSIVEEGALTGDIEDVVAWSMGVRQLQQGYYDAAIALFHQIQIRPQPEYATVFCMIGWCHTLKGKYEEATQYYEQAFELNSRNPLVYICRGIQFQQQNNLQKAIRDFERAQYLDKSSIEVHLQMSILQAKIGNAREAERNMQLAIELDSLERNSVHDVFTQKGFWSVYDEKGMTASDFIDQGYFFYKIGKYEKAIECLHKSLRLKPNNFDAWFGLANTYYEIGEKREALKCYDKVTELNPKDYEVWNSKGVICSQLNQTDQALYCYQRSIEIKEDYYDAWYNLGNSYSNIGSFDKAKSCYLTVLNEVPNYNKAWTNLGSVYAVLDSFDQAEKCFHKALEIKENNYLAWKNLAQIQYTLGQIDEAKSSIQNSIKFNSTFDEAWNLLGLLHMESGDTAKAKLYFQQAIDLNGSSTDAWNNLGVIYQKSKQSEIAFQYFEKAVNIDSTNYLALNNLGVIYSEMPNVELAIKYYKKSIEVNANYYQAWTNLCGIYLQLDMIKLAKESCEQAIKIEPSYHMSLNNMASIYLKTDQTELAIKYFSKSIEIKAGNCEAWNGLGLVYSELNQYDKAFFTLQKAIEVDSNKAYPYNNRANLYRKTGDLPRAKTDVQKSLSLDKNNGWAYATLAMIDADENNVEGFYHHLETAISSPNPYPLKKQFDKEQTLQRYKHDPRFQALLAKSEK